MQLPAFSHSCTTGRQREPSSKFLYTMRQHISCLTGCLCTTCTGKIPPPLARGTFLELRTICSKLEILTCTSLLRTIAPGKLSASPFRSKISLQIHDFTLP